MKTNRALMLFLLVMLGFAACKKESLVESVVTIPGNGTEVCGSAIFTLWAGQTINAGTLTVSNDDLNLYVTYSTSFSFGTLHLWVGADMSLLPVNNQGTPVPGHFPYSFDASGLNTYKFTIPLSQISSNTKCTDTVFVVAHAEVSIEEQSETAFGGDIPGINTNRWYFYGKYVVACCETPPVQDFDTAFAKGRFVFASDPDFIPPYFTSLNLSANSLGWAINLKESDKGLTYYRVYTGAVKNDYTKGTYVASVTINYDGEKVIIKYYLLWGSPWKLSEWNIYAGDNKPTTIDPDLFGNTFYGNPVDRIYTATINVSDTDGNGIWIIVQSVIYQ